MYRWESLTTKKTECRRIDVFELWCWRRPLRIPWTARRSNYFHPKGNQSWIFIGRTDAEAETPILWPRDVKNWPLWKRPWCWERLKVGWEGDERGWDGWMASPVWCTWVWASCRSLWWIGKPGELQALGLKIVRHNWVTELSWMWRIQDSGQPHRCLILHPSTLGRGSFPVAVWTGPCGRERKSLVFLNMVTP